MTGRQGGPSSIAIRVKNFVSMLSKLVLKPGHLLIQWVTEAFSQRTKQPGREADHSPTARTEGKTTRTDLYIHFAIYLHGVVLN
jgi:hypothetical protein